MRADEREAFRCPKLGGIHYDIQDTLIVLWQSKWQSRSPEKRALFARQFLDMSLRAPDQSGVQMVKYGIRNIRCRYRWRYAEKTDLACFEQLSEENDAIIDSQPESLVRSELYEDWFKDGDNKSCFILLEESLEDGSEPLPIACSIILPLGQFGLDALSRPGVSAAQMGGD